MLIDYYGILIDPIYPNKTVGGCIDVFENIWDNTEFYIKEVEMECASQNSDLFWKKAETIGDGVNQSKRTNYNLGITEAANFYDIKIAKEIHNKFHNTLLATLGPYCKKHDISAFLHEPYNLLKYSSGEYYGSHYDGTPASGRHVSAILYLNDNYQGGEIEFVNFNIKIKPKAGTLLIFPSNYAYTHIAHPIIDGVKYSIVTWMHDA